MSDDTEERPSILVVDDRPDQLLALDAILAPLGVPIVHATSGEEALRQLLRGTFAVILLDVRLAGISGLETAELIKSRERTRFIPIIFMTGVDNREQTAITRAYSAGAVDFVFKPFEPEVLRSKVAVFVDLFRQQRRGFKGRSRSSGLSGLPIFVAAPAANRDHHQHRGADNQAAIALPDLAKLLAAQLLVNFIKYFRHLIHPPRI